MARRHRNSSGQPGFGPSRSVVILGPLSRRINRFVLRVAGRPHTGPIAKIHHRGRRSGRAHVAPVMARPTDDQFLVPLFFGAGADWCRNVLAAGECQIEWHGAIRRMRNPRVLGTAAVQDQVRATFPLHERLVLRIAGINEFLIANSEPAGTA
ncbi:MAG TPA: nitroreductase/quinone reductase family protein [Sporichthyaceae bacterium]|jgi:deazaflavin-dependent oxidoreductase (nitroreductase family)|nr:nitroreductase/quinone reductase family protein [Sporichthyaceae bacterium]